MVQIGNRNFDSWDSLIAFIRRPIGDEPFRPQLSIEEAMDLHEAPLPLGGLLDEEGRPLPDPVRIGYGPRPYWWNTPYTGVYDTSNRNGNRLEWLNLVFGSPQAYIMLLKEQDWAVIHEWQ
jgi:hypothetical protein